LTIDDAIFDRYHYDEVADTLCFHTEPAAWAVNVDETLEDHLLRYDADGDLLSLTILNARWLLDRDDAIEVTLRDGGPTTRLEREAIEPLLVETPLTGDFEGKLVGWD
jgi:uncharacterized protein YuzE